MRLLGSVAVFLWIAGAAAQTKRPQLSPVEVEKLEKSLQSDPSDRAARSALLEYYFLGKMDPSVAIPERRRHILWVIENAPDDQIAYGPLVTIDSAGHSLADPQGFQLAADAWRAQAGKPDVKPMTLANAAYFFKMDDKPYTIGLLKRALSLDPKSKEIAARLGDEYALVILGVTMVNRSSYPLRNDRAETESVVAQQSRADLAVATNPYVLAKAGYQLLWQGVVLYYSRRLPFDPEPLAKSALDRAVSLAPRDPGVAALRAEYDKFQSEKRRTLPAGSRPKVATTEAPSTSLPSAPSLPTISAEALKKVTTGMTRDQLLALGSPSGRLTMDEDGHLIERYQYSANGTHLGTVRLTDGIVSSVQIP